VAYKPPREPLTMTCFRIAYNVSNGKQSVADATSPVLLQIGVSLLMEKKRMAMLRHHVVALLEVEEYWSNHDTLLTKIDVTCAGCWNDG